MVGRNGMRERLRRRQHVGDRQVVPDGEQKSSPPHSRNRYSNWLEPIIRYLSSQPLGPRIPGEQFHKGSMGRLRIAYGPEEESTRRVRAAVLRDTNELEPDASVVPVQRDVVGPHVDTGLDGAVLPRRP